MKQQIKSGQQVLEEFMASIEKNSHLDKDTVASITELYKESKLTKTNLTNSLSDIRDKKHNENK